MTSFKDLKGKRTVAYEKLSKKLEDSNKQSFRNAEDDKIWRPTKDAQGNGFAVFRFFHLPQEDSDEPPYIKRWEHAFKGVGGWYIENSRTTLGGNEPDPCSEYNSKLWETNDQELQEQVRKQKRKKYYFANIYMIKDSGNPENNGKVFVFKFGQKIMDKITEIEKPSYEGDEPINPFDLWEGVDFRFAVSEVAGYPNYDKSKFNTKPTPIAESDAEIEAIWKQRHDLAEFLAPSAFKPYDELKVRLEKVLGLSGNGEPVKSASDKFSFDDEDEDDKPSTEKSGSSKFNFDDDEAEKPAKQSKPKDDDDDDLDFFNSLASK